MSADPSPTAMTEGEGEVAAALQVAALSLPPGAGLLDPAPYLPVSATPSSLWEKDGLKALQGRSSQRTAPTGMPL